MRLTISIEYYTVLGESLFVVLADGKEFPMRYVADGIWATEFNVPISWKIVDYGFVVKKDGQIVRREWSGLF